MGKYFVKILKISMYLLNCQGFGHYFLWVLKISCGKYPHSRGESYTLHPHSSTPSFLAHGPSPFSCRMQRMCDSTYSSSIWVLMYFSLFLCPLSKDNEALILKMSALNYRTPNVGTPTSTKNPYPFHYY